MNNSDHPTPRPGDPFTAQDAAKAFDNLSRELRSFSSQIPSILNRQIEILETLSRIEEGLTGSRISRLEQEVREAELELERAQASQRAAEERLKLKSEVKETSIDTQERLNRVAAHKYEEIEREKRSRRDAQIADLKFSVIKAVVTWGAIGIVALIGSVLWYLLQEYLSRGSP